MANPAVEPTPATIADPSDPYVRAAQTFPTLNDEMVQRIARFGSEEAVADGGYLFRRGERTVDFFLVLEGAIDILEHHGDGSDTSVHRHGVKLFTGELDLFNDRQILVSGRADGLTGRLGSCGSSGPIFA